MFEEFSAELGRAEPCPSCKIATRSCAPLVCKIFCLKTEKFENIQKTFDKTAESYNFIFHELASASKCEGRESFALIPEKEKRVKMSLFQTVEESQKPNP